MDRMVEQKRGRNKWMEGQMDKRRTHLPEPVEGKPLEKEEANVMS